MKQISYGKQRETKNSTPQIEVVTDAMLRTPMHPRKQMECFADKSIWGNTLNAVAEDRSGARDL
jgi:hypothetical protein